jgi:hypothetical protein
MGGIYEVRLEMGSGSVTHLLIFIKIGSDMTASVVLWSEFLATDPEVPGSIPGATRFSEK